MLVGTGSRTRRALVSVLPCLALMGVAAAAQRPLKVEDFDRMQAVADPACSADGRWVAYTVDSVDTGADEHRSRVWIASTDGMEQRPLTAPERSAEKPRFSPDGRYVSFLATQSGDEKSELYLLDRRGGEAQRVGPLPGSVQDYDWSPDGRRLVLSMTRDKAVSDEAMHTESAHEDAPHAKAESPIVINNLHFKEDGIGYVTEADFPQLYLLEIGSGRLEALTTDRRFEDQLPVFSPDGSGVAYISDQHGDPYRTGRREIYLIEAHAGAKPRLLTEFFEPNYPSLHFTPDGRRLVYAEGLEPRLTAYIQDHLKAIDLETKQVVALAPRLDRALRWPVPISSEALIATVEDDGSEVAARVPLSGGPIERLLDSGRVVTGLCAAAGHVTAVVSTDASPPELYALEGRALRRLSHHNDALMAGLAVAPVEDMHFASRDGTEIHGMLVKPIGYQPGRRYPTILWIHGGPVGQDAHVLSFEGYSPELERQWFAAHGYLVLAVNYRGGSGRGAAFASAIAADWGGKEVEDLRAAIDYAVRTGLADPDRLAVGGWSYGAILTDYMIASDPRFKAAIVGAGSGDQIATYGSDQYVMQYNAEVGPPWRASERWLRLSYPFFHADRIHTPTLFLGGQRDFNVPIIGGEQMYEALRTLGVPTQLVIYPGQFHIFTRPSYIRDRLQRYLDWYRRYLAR